MIPMKFIFSICLLCLINLPGQAALQAYFGFEKDGNVIKGSSANNLKASKYNTSGKSNLPEIITDAPPALSKHSKHSLKTNKAYLRVQNVSDISLGENFTLNFWVKINSLKDDIIGFAGQRSNYKRLDWNLFYRSKYKSIYFWAGPEAKYKFSAKLRTPLVPGKWYMISLVKNKSSIKVYINTSKICTWAFKDRIDSNSCLVIGGLDFGGRYAFDGMLDDFAIWDNSLSLQQITKLYSGTNPLTIIKDKIKRWNYAKPGTKAKLPAVSFKAKRKNEIKIYGRPQHPCVNYTAKSIALARKNVKRYKWAQKYFAKELQNAKRWASKPASYWLKFLPKPDAVYAYGFSGCPKCGSGWGRWAYARCSWDKPGKVTCTNGHVFPDASHPDNGDGWKGPDGKIHYFTASWNAWVTEQWTLFAIPSLTLAYVITGEDKYAELATTMLDALASIYSQSTSGSIDYPSYQIGRLARPNYQVARNLVKYVDAYDLLYNFKGMDKPSIQKGLSRRRNIEENMLLDGAFFCYKHTFTNSLHNGHAD